MKTLKKTEIQAGKAAAPSVKTMSLVIPEGAIRLAHQLHQDPAVLVHQLLHRGIQAVDENLMHGCGTFAHGNGEFDPTEALEGLTLEGIDYLEEFFDHAQRVLYVREMERRGVAYEGEPLKAPAGYAAQEIGGAS